VTKRSELTITTPEHVEIRLDPASPGSRFLAIAIDSLVTFGAAAVIARIAAVVLPRGVAYAVFTTASFLLTWGWHVYFDTKHHGRTPGKRALSLRVVDARGLPVSLYQSLVRNICRAIDMAPAFYGIAAVVTLLDPHRRRFGDLVADTLVIRETPALAYTGQLAAERRHNSLRTARVLRAIRHRISLEERELLLMLCIRADKMTASARYDLMEEVARTYRAKLGVEEESISGENFVRDLTAVLFQPRAS
jgi:uncharacterized RDD family membrane protein YckC